MEFKFEKLLKGEVGIEGCGLVPVVYSPSPDRSQILPVSALRTFLVLQHHLDHLPAAEGLTLIVPEPLAGKIEEIYRRYELRPKILEHEIYVQTFHYNVSRVGKIVKSPSFCLVFEDSVHITESAELRRLMERFGDYKHGTVCRVPRTDTLERPLTLEELPKGWYLADNGALARFSERVIPKCVPTLSDGAALTAKGKLKPAYISFMK
jgi:hypothetical protein